MKRLILLTLAMVVAGVMARGADAKPNPSKPAKNEKKAATSNTDNKQGGVVVFNNTLNYLGRYFFSSNEFGDQIQLSTQVTNRLFLKFQLEYFLSDNASGDESIRIRFYDNKGSNGSPGKLLYRMAKPMKLKKGYNSMVIEGLPLELPDNFTWTVEFIGVAGEEKAGLLFYDPPSIGVAYDDYWEKENGGWTCRKVAGLAANFGMQVQALGAGVPLPLLAMAQPNLTPGAPRGGGANDGYNSGGGDLDYGSTIPIDPIFIITNTTPSTYGSPKCICPPERSRQFYIGR
jgi:hypothetical protein